MNMDIWYDLLVRELAHHVDRAAELREDAEERVSPEYAEADPPGESSRRPVPPRATTPYPAHGTPQSQW